MDKSILTTRLFGLAVAFTFIVFALGAFAPQAAYAQQGWNHDSKGFWYEYDNKGHYYKNGWQRIYDDWGYFQSDGYAKEGWVKSGKKWYYLYSPGSDYPPYMLTADRTGIIKLGKSWYYFDGSGAMVTGWKQIDGNWYLFASSGAMRSGWAKSGNVWYFLDNNGVMQIGWRQLGGTWYYLKSSGAMVTGWQKIGGQWYYFSNSGAMQKNKWIGNYYVQGDGSMAVNKWIGKYHVDKNGKWDKTKRTEVNAWSNDIDGKRVRLTGVLQKQGYPAGARGWSAVVYWLVFDEPIAITYKDYYNGDAGTNKCTRDFSTISVAQSENYSFSGDCVSLDYEKQKIPDLEQYLGKRITVEGYIINTGNAHTFGYATISDYRVVTD